MGVEYVYMRHPEVVQWLRQRMESTQNSETYSDEKRKHFFYHLKLAVGFENFIHKKFVGQKRFSLEGAEAIIPALDAVIEKGAELGMEEFIMGMAHRGRLNILANILEKPYQNIFKEFYGKEYEDDITQGDVKYHLGYENEVVTDFNKKVKLKLLPNPSHLETVAPIVEGMVRSQIESQYERNYDKAAAIVIHGDAAIATQGVVYETTQMSQLPGYKTGGTIHLVINNQVGFYHSVYRSTVEYLLYRRGKSYAVTRFPCKWRRCGSIDLDRKTGHGIPSEISFGCVYRYFVLPQIRAQRRRRTSFYSTHALQSNCKT